MSKKQKSQKNQNQIPISGFKKLCHQGPVEVYPKLYCGSYKESLDMVRAPIKVDTLVALDSADSRIWHLGFRGSIFYFPTPDYSVLPLDILNIAVNAILRELNKGHKVGIFCLGGHGRTGYLAAAVLGKLNISDPIEYIRSHYCKLAIESNTQVDQLAIYLKNPDLSVKYHIKERGFVEDDWFDNYYYRFPKD